MREAGLGPAIQKMHEQLTQILLSKGAEVVSTNVFIETYDEAIRQAHYLRNEDIDCLILEVGTWVDSNLVVAAAQSLKLPMLLWVNAIKKTEGLVGGAVAHGSLDEVKIRHKYIYGNLDEEDIVKNIWNFAVAACAVKSLRNQKYGLFGGRSLEMYTAHIDPSQWRSLFAVEVEHIDEYAVILEAENIPKKLVDQFIEYLKKNFGKVNASQELLEKNTRVYLALKRIIKKHDLDFIGVKCHPELSSNYATYCIAYTFLTNLYNEEGDQEPFVVACEADSNAALTMQILKLISNQPVLLGDFRYAKDGMIILANCGAAPLYFAKSKDDVWWYGGGLSGRAMCDEFVCRPGKVTVARLVRIDGKYKMIILRGECVEMPREKMRETVGHSHWPHAFIKTNADLKGFVQEARTNHLLMTYGDFLEVLVQVCQILGIDFVHF